MKRRKTKGRAKAAPVVDLRDEWIIRMITDRAQDMCRQITNLTETLPLEDVAIVIHRLPGRESGLVACARTEASGLAATAGDAGAARILKKTAGPGRVWVFAMVGHAARVVPFNIADFASDVVATLRSSY